MTEKENLEIVFQTLFDEAKQVVAEAHEPGIMDYIKERHRARYEEILDTEAEIPRLWQEMRQGKDTLEDFRSALFHWERLCLQAVELYKAGGP